MVQAISTVANMGSITTVGIAVYLRALKFKIGFSCPHHRVALVQALVQAAARLGSRTQTY